MKKTFSDALTQTQQILLIDKVCISLNIIDLIQYCFILYVNVNIFQKTETDQTHDVCGAVNTQGFLSKANTEILDFTVIPTQTQQIVCVEKVCYLLYSM